MKLENLHSLESVKLGPHTRRWDLFPFFDERAGRIQQGMVGSDGRAMRARALPQRRHTVDPCSSSFRGASRAASKPNDGRRHSRSAWLSPALLLLAVLMMVPASEAFPPAPHHLIHGLVRDEMGNPLMPDNAEVFFETSAGVKLTTRIMSIREPGVNYHFAVPMDSGITSDLYMATAMRPTVPFKIRVRIGNSIFLPIEMKGDYSSLGQPGKTTLLNLTLGEDADGDGLPDAWERALIAAAGRNQTLVDITPGDDSDGDGLRNADEYVAGTYAFDNKDGYALKILGSRGAAAVLEFMAIRGRTYSIYASQDLLQWEPVSFRLVLEGAQNPSIPSMNYQADKVRVARVEVESNPGSPPAGFYKLMVR